MCAQNIKKCSGCRKWVPRICPWCRDRLKIAAFARIPMWMYLCQCACDRNTQWRGVNTVCGLEASRHKVNGVKWRDNIDLRMAVWRAIWLRFWNCIQMPRYICSQLYTLVCTIPLAPSSFISVFTASLRHHCAQVTSLLFTCFLHKRTSLLLPPPICRCMEGILA